MYARGAQRELSVQQQILGDEGAARAQREDDEPQGICKQLNDNSDDHAPIMPSPRERLNPIRSDEFLGSTRVFSFRPSSFDRRLDRILPRSPPDADTPGSLLLR